MMQQGVAAKQNEEANNDYEAKENKKLFHFNAKFSLLEIVSKL
jgi:hypothetical protein